MLGLNEYEFVGIDVDYAHRLACWCRDYLEELDLSGDMSSVWFSRHYHDGICAGMRISLARADQLEIEVTSEHVRMTSTLDGHMVLEYKLQVRR